MATKSIKVFFAISIVFYILVGFYLWYSVYIIRATEFENATETASYINSQIDSAYSVDYSFSSKYFLERTEDIFLKFPKLAGIIIDSGSDSLQYISLRNSRLLSSGASEVIAEGSVPELTFSHPFIKVSHTSLYFTNGVAVRSTLVFDLLDRSILFPILRNCLIISLAYLAFSVIIYSISGSGSKHSNKSSEPSAEPSESLQTEVPAANEFVEQEILPPPVSSIPPAPEQSSGLYSDRSGLVWEHFLSEKLDAELKRAASFDQDSCLVFISIKSPSGFIPYRNISELIVEHFKYKDLAFESGENTFCIIIPETDIDEGQVEVEKFTKSILTRFPDSEYKIYAGLTSRNSRLLSESRMLKEAKAALTKAESENCSTTIAFRTDLNKYREYIASNM